MLEVNDGDKSSIERDEDHSQDVMIVQESDVVHTNQNYSFEKVCRHPVLKLICFMYICD